VERTEQSGSGRPPKFLGRVLGILLAAGSVSFAPQDASKKEPRFLLLHDWYDKSPASTPAFIRENREFLDARPFDGIAVYVRTPDQSLNVSTSILSEKMLGYSEIADALAPLKGLAFRHLTENFAAVIGGRPPDFMDDWSAPIVNFAHLARAARQAGLKGIYFDNEMYYAPWADYPKGVRHPEKSLADYQDRARLRGREVMQAMVAQFPEITILLLHGPYISEPRAPAPLFPQLQSNNELHGPFFAGFVEGAGERARVVDGGELYHLRTEEQFRKSYEWRKNALPSAEIDCTFIPAATRAVWGDRVSLGFGVYDQSFKGVPMNPEVLETTLARALRRSDRYVWLYVEGPSFLKPSGEGGAPADWVEAVRRAKAAAVKEPAR